MENLTNKQKQEKYPIETIELPSKGHFYPSDNPLSTGTIKLRQPTAKHEDILTSKNLITKGIVIDEFLKSIIIDDINYDSLLIGDKNGIMIASRILLYGPQYKTQVKCPSCSTLNTKTYDLSELETKEINFDNYPRGMSEFDYILPVSKIPIKVKLLTVKDEMDINNHIKISKKHGNRGIDNEMSIRLSYIITEWNGNRNKAKILQYVTDELLSKDSYELRNFLIDLNPGIDTDVHFECEECGFESTISLPMDVNFFWPTRRLQS